MHTAKAILVTVLVTGLTMALLFRIDFTKKLIAPTMP